MRGKFYWRRLSFFSLLAAALILGGCGDDGKDGRDGVDGVTTIIEVPAAQEDPAESCAVCHDTGSVYSAPAAHEIDREISYTVVTPPTADGDDLVVVFDIRVNGQPYDSLTLVQRTVIFQGIGGEYTRNQFANNSHTFLESVIDGVYTFRIPGASNFVGTDARVYFRLNDPEGVEPRRRASVNADDAAYARLDLVSDQSCKNCHGEFAGGLTSHHYNPFDASNCIACHSAVNPPGGIGMAYLTHGIHNSQNLPDGQIDIEGAIFKITYPTYMANCSVCHDSGATLAAANAMPVTGPNCFSCHGDMTSSSFDFSQLTFHSTYDETTDCQACHTTGGIARATVAEYHNGSRTGNGGIIFNGVDTSVTEGAKFDWQITGIVDNGVNLAITWIADYNGLAVDPCNATSGAPLFHADGSGNLSMLRSYAQGDDFILGQSTSAPGQALAVNVTTANTTCTSLVATTTIPVDNVDADRGIVALQGKPRVVSVVDATETMSVRAKTPTREWVVGSGAEPLDTRRAVVDTGKCLDCHVGSLYQHGGNRVDNVDMCILCHNSASNEQSVRVGLGVDASEAYDGKVGETFEMKTMLHRIHAAGVEGSPTYLVYRNRGIYAFGPDEAAIPNWPGTGQQIVYGSEGDRVINHNFHSATYPRALNACVACHDAAFDFMPDPTKAMATTVDAGSDEWINQLDDKLQGATTTACITCHTDSATRGHAYQNGWIPQEFPEGRQTIIDAAR